MHSPPPITELDAHQVPYGVPGFITRLRKARVLVCGLGNIGSYLAGLLGNLVGFIRVVDRDRVEAGNFANQDYAGAGSVGQFKVDLIADRLAAEHPGLVVERRAMDLERLPFGDVDDVDICLGGLDSLRAQKLISDRAYPLGVPVIDGGVGAPLLASVRCYLPGSGCLECSWSPQHYRTTASEYQCFAGVSTSQVSPALAGHTVAGLMSAAAVRLLTGNGSASSEELTCDLLHGRFLTSRLPKADGCRHDHVVVRPRLPLEVAFAEATLADLLAVAEAHFGVPPESFEFRCLPVHAGPFGVHRCLSPATLAAFADRRLAELRLSERDYVRVRSSARPGGAYVVLSPSPRQQEASP